MMAKQTRNPKTPSSPKAGLTKHKLAKGGKTRKKTS